MSANNLHGVSTNSSISTMATGGGAAIDNNDEDETVSDAEDTDYDDDDDNRKTPSSMLSSEYSAEEASTSSSIIPDHNKIRAYAETILYMVNKKEAKRAEVEEATKNITVHDSKDNNSSSSSSKKEASMTSLLFESFNFEDNVDSTEKNRYNFYHDDNNEDLEDFANLASPSVISKLLQEQAIVIDDAISFIAEDDYDNDYNDDDDDDDCINRNFSSDYDDDDEKSIMNLKDELAAATNLSFSMLHDDGDYEVLGPVIKARERGGGVAAQSKISINAHDITNNRMDWNDNRSIQQYNTGDARTSNINSSINNNRFIHSSGSTKYSLSDHAYTIHLSRHSSNLGLYTKPLLTCNIIESATTITISLPRWLKQPQGEGSSHDRESYMKRILDCAVEYIEPLKSRMICKLFIGWNSGPGEYKSGNASNTTATGTAAGADSDERVTSFATATTSPTGTTRATATMRNNNNDDVDASSSVEGEDNDYGFEDIGTGTMPFAASSSLEPLPVRTVTIRIRCDAMCGSIMDSLTTSVERMGGNMTKRQGGHLRAVLPGKKIRVWRPGERAREDSRNENNNSDNDDVSVASGLSLIIAPILGRKQKGPTYDVLPPLILDAQLVTSKTDCQRLVLIRFFRMQDVARVRMRMGEVVNEEEFYDMITPLPSSPRKYSAGDEEYVDDDDEAGDNGGHVDPLEETLRSLNNLQEAAALVQQIKSLGGSGFAIDLPQPMRDGDDESVSSRTSAISYLKSFGDAITSPIRLLGSINEGKPLSSSVSYPTVMELMTAHLMTHYTHSPSVGTSSKSALQAAKRKSKGLFPALSKKDVPFVKSTWMFLKDCIEELDRRCLAYSTLGVYPAFQFPALPTLDGHFISQIKTLCRENMITSLVKTASDLESYAREYEISCGNVEQLLRPTFEMYKLTPPQLPMPVPLTAYPLDFRAPEDVMPPWGPEVMAALTSLEISCENTQADESCDKFRFERSENAVAIIVAAFQKQNDLEQGARLGRKNMQVMDRLAKMLAHKRNSIVKIRDCYARNLLATKAADDFHAFRLKSSNIGSLSDVMDAATNEVPLLICNVLVGQTAGICYVTHSHVLFNTQLMPILGRNKVSLFSIMDVEVTINTPSKSILNPLPASLSFTTAVFGRKSGTREEVYNFIPSIGARRFAKFIEVLKDVTLDDSESLKFSAKGGLIYLAT